jgi:hypothetical protein
VPGQIQWRRGWSVWDSCNVVSSWSAVPSSSVGSISSAVRSMRENEVGVRLEYAPDNIGQAAGCGHLSLSVGKL